ncbi:MAG: hypothetical protein PHQ23_17650, partial [Candidatus Wallbacteria bacterium]|nr:hypothetical protein [Candidatus Wallbacteria bacterium]
QILAIDRDNAPALEKAAHAAASLGKWKVVSRHLSGLKNLNPNNPESYFGLAEADIHLERPEAAVANLCQILERFPMFLNEVLQRHGRFLSFPGYKDFAPRLVEKALSMLKHSGDVEAAESILRDSCVNFPEVEQFRLELAELLNLKGRHTEALDQLRSVSEENRARAAACAKSIFEKTADIKALDLLYNFCTGSEKWREILRLARRKIQFDKRDGDYYLLQAAFFQAAGDALHTVFCYGRAAACGYPGKAIEALRSLKADSSILHYADFVRMRAALAHEFKEEFLRGIPGLMLVFPRAGKILELFFSARKFWEFDRQCYEKLHELAGENQLNPNIQAAYGFRSFVSGDLVMAEKSLSRASQVHPKSGVIFRIMAEFHLECGRFENAAEAVSRARFLSPMSPAIKSLRDTIFQKLLDKNITECKALLSGKKLSTVPVLSGSSKIEALPGPFYKKNSTDRHDRQSVSLFLAKKYNDKGLFEESLKILPNTAGLSPGRRCGILMLQLEACSGSGYIDLVAEKSAALEKELSGMSEKDSFRFRYRLKRMMRNRA